MKGSILQLQTKGKENLYLTVNPQINFFKGVHYRYINFSTDIIQLNLTELATFGRSTSCIIEKKGHLLSKLYLQLSLPPLQTINGTYLSWADTIGYCIFSDAIELLIDGVIIDRLYPVFLDSWDEVSLNESKRVGRNLMILKSDIFRSNIYNATEPITLMIPLEFWFTKDYSLALPLMSLYTDDIRIQFTLRPFLECVNYDGTLLPSVTEVAIMDANIFAEYIWLDNDFIVNFQKEEHKYIIQQCEYHGDEIINSQYTNYATRLKFSNPSKELFINFVSVNNYMTNNYFNYSNMNGSSFISNISMYLNGIARFDNIPEIYFRTVFPDSVHTCIPNKYIYCIPFCLNPENIQPSGCLSMSQFDDITLNFKLLSGNPDLYLYIYSVIYNILTIKNGKMFFEYPI